MRITVQSPGLYNALCNTWRGIHLCSLLQDFPGGLYMPMIIQALILEERPTDVEAILGALRSGGYEPDWRCVDTEQQFVAHLDTNVDVILANYHLSGLNSLRALQLLREHNVDIPFIAITQGIGDEAVAVCM